MNSGIVVLMKHVEKNDFPVLVDALGIPPVFRWGIFTRLGPLTVVTIFMFFFGVQCIIYIYIYIYMDIYIYIYNLHRRESSSNK